MFTRLLDALWVQPQHTLGALREMYRDGEPVTGLEVTLALANNASLEVRDGLNVRCIVPLTLTAIRSTLELNMCRIDMLEFC